MKYIQSWTRNLQMREVPVLRSVEPMFNDCQIAAALGLLALLAPPIALAQSPDGPIAPRPGVTAQQQPPQLPIKVQVTLVNTPVVVRNSKGEMVTTLEAKDFQITDNGAPQQIAHFDLGTDPISMVLSIENSSRISALLPAIHKTGILFTQTVLGPSGEAALLSFNDEVDKLQDFTADNDLLEKSIAGISSGSSGAKLYDAMAFGVEMLTSRPQQLKAPSARRRRILMILAESSDYGSTAKLGEVLRQAQLANVTIYSVGLSTTRAELQSKEPPNEQTPMTPPGTFGRPPMPGTVQTPDTAAAQEGVSITDAALWAVLHAKNQGQSHALEMASAATGGTHLSTLKDRSIEKAIDEIGAELHAQYTLSYAPNDTEFPGYHDIAVTVSNKKLTVRTRPGYYLP